jgi:hypothetical protein
MKIKSIKIGISFYILMAIILVAGFIRARINFSSDLIPGINGGYYPLLVRNLIEHGSIRYPDTPLVYYLQALITIIIKLFSSLDTNESVLLASRLSDSFIPPLLSIPVFLFAHLHFKENDRPPFFLFLVTAFSILNLVFLVIMSSEMQKNAIGLIWVAWYFYSLSRITSGTDREHQIMSAISLILVAITHIGSFAIAFAFSIIYCTVFLVQCWKRIRTKTILKTLAIVIGIALISIAVLSKDPDRLQRVISIYINPLRIFESPYILILLSGQQVFFGLLFYQFITIHVLSIVGFLILLKNRYRLSRRDFTFALSLSLLSLLLSSPLIGIEWALRFSFMAFLPITFLSIFVFKSLSSQICKAIFSAVLLGLTTFSVFIGITGHRNPSISPESYSSLLRMNKNVLLNPDDLIVARHGLEWWVGWSLKTRTGKEYCLRREDWDKYPNIYLLRQKKGNNFPSLAGSGQFAELPIMSEASTIESNEFFTLYQLSKPIETQNYPGELPLIQGDIVAIKGRELVIRSNGYRHKVYADSSITDISAVGNEIARGMRADIWGKRRPFSLNIQAEKIKIYQVD